MKQYVIGVSNTTTGNGWREEMICSIKAQALVSGQVSSLNIQQPRHGSAADQLEDIRNLDRRRRRRHRRQPVSATRINDAIKEAIAKGIKVVAVDQGVTEPWAYLISNDQKQYAYLGAKWLFEHLGGKGAVVYMGGIAGTQADTDRKAGLRAGASRVPGHHRRPGDADRLAVPQGKKQMADILASGHAV